MGGKYRILYTKKEKKEGRENGKCRYKIVSIKNDEKKIIIISKIIATKTFKLFIKIFETVPKVKDKINVIINI